MMRLEDRFSDRKEEAIGTNSSKGACCKAVKLRSKVCSIERLERVPGIMHPAPGTPAFCIKAKMLSHFQVNPTGKHASRPRSV